MITSSRFNSELITLFFLPAIFWSVVKILSKMTMRWGEGARKEGARAAGRTQGAAQRAKEEEMGQEVAATPYTLNPKCLPRPRTPRPLIP